MVAIGQILDASNGNKSWHADLVVIFIHVVASSQCDLTCISEETRDLLITDSEVMDGTPCVYEDPYNLCIRGNCVVCLCMLSLILVV